MSDHSVPAIPPGPADITYSRLALARLALSSVVADLSESAAGLVPTVSDGYAQPCEFVEHAARLVAAAHEVLRRAVVYARDAGGSWADLAEAIDGSAASANEVQERFAGAIRSWEDALNQPLERSGRYLASRLPDGAADPDRCADYLDQWCVRNLEPSDGARYNARHSGIEDRMVSAKLPKHTRLTELNSLLRTACYLNELGDRATDAEWQAYHARKAAILGNTNQ